MTVSWILALQLLLQSPGSVVSRKLFETKGVRMDLFAEDAYRVF